MGSRKLFNGPLSLILTLITLLFLISFVVGQAPAPAPAVPAPAPAKAPAKEADAKKEPAKANNKAPAKEAKGKAKEDAKGAKVAKGTKDPKDPKGAKDAKAKADPKAAAKAPAPPAAAAPSPPPPPPAPPAPPVPVPVPTPDPNLAKECNDCWTAKRSDLPACKGISKEEFTAFNKSPNSPKVASCLCLFANSMASVFENVCSAVCVDQKLITDLNNQASQYKTTYKCDDKGNSILGSSNNLAEGSGNQTASAISNNINENNMILGLSFMIGMGSFLIFN